MHFEAPSSSKKRMKEDQMWQHPYVNIFKYAGLPEKLDCFKNGDVLEMMDKQIGRRVYRIRGSISATNYLHIPSKESNGSMSLLGRFLYLQLRGVGNKMLTFHVETATESGNALRLSFGTMYREEKFTGHSIRLPISLREGHWTILAIDLKTIFEKECLKNTQPFAFVKSLELCSNMLVRGAFTSDYAYTEDTLPKEMAFPLPHRAKWSDVFDWQWYPETPDVSFVHPADSALGMPFHRTAARVQARSEIPTSDNNPGYSEWTEPSQKPSGFHQTLHPKDLENEAASILNKENLQATGNGAGGWTPDISKLNISSATPESHTRTQHGKGSFVRSTARKRPPRETSEMKYGPNLQLKKVIGSGTDLKSKLEWGAEDRYMISTANTHLILREMAVPKMDDTNLQQDDQHFLVGQSDDVIRTLEVSHSGYVVAVAHEGPSAAVRIWNLESRKCIAHFKAHATGTTHLAFSNNDKHLCTVGTDQRRRPQIIIWDLNGLFYLRVSALNNGPPAFASVLKEKLIVARQLSGFGVNKIRFNPYERNRLVSCGKENIRFWRVKHQHLPGSSCSLGEFARGTEFTDIAFDNGCGLGGTIAVQKIVFVGSSSGTVLQLQIGDDEKASLMCVLRLHDGPISRLIVNEGFVATGSEDCFVRLWPLDFSDYLMEAKHEAPISSMALSRDGLKLLIGTTSGSLGLLDICTHGYSALMRSHTGQIHSLAFPEATSQEEFATAGMDGTIRIWSLVDRAQKYEFNSPEDMPTCLAYRPESDSLACGFQSGCLRIFDIPNTMTLHEYQQHRKEILQILYRRDGKLLYSVGKDGQLCSYDGIRDHQPVRMIALDMGPGRACMALSADQKWLAIAGSDECSILIFDAESLQPKRQIGGDARNVLWPSISRIEDPSMLAVEVHQEEPPSIEPILFLKFSLEGPYALGCTETQAVLLDADSSEGTRSLGNLCCKLNIVSALQLTEGWALALASEEKSEIHIQFLMLEEAENGNVHNDIFLQTSYKAHHVQVTALQFCQDGSQLVSCDTSGVIFIWTVTGLPSPVLKPRTSLFRDLSGKVPTGLRDEDDNTLISDDVGSDQMCMGPGDLKDAQYVTSAGTSSPIFQQESPLNEPVHYDAQLYDILEQEFSKLPGTPRISSKQLAEMIGRGERTAKVNMPHEQQSNLYGQPSDTTPNQYGWISYDGLCRRQPASSNTARLQVLVKACPPSKNRGQPCGVSKGQGAMGLKRIIGFSGQLHDNIVWLKEAGFIVYAAATYVVVENLRTSRQRFLGINRHESDISVIKASPDGMLLATSSAYTSPGTSRMLSNLSSICLWEHKGGTYAYAAALHELDVHGVQAMEFSQDGSYLAASGCWDAEGQKCKLVIWCLEEGTVAYTGLVSWPVLDIGAVRGPEVNVQDLPPQFCFGGIGGAVCVEVQKGIDVKLKNLENLDMNVVAVRSAWTEYAGVLLLLGCSDGSLFTWSLDRSSCIGSKKLFLPDKEDQLISMQVLGRTVYFGMASGSLEVWDLPKLLISAEGEPENRWRLGSAVTSIQTSKEGGCIVVGTAACLIWVVDQLGETVNQLVTGHAEEITIMAINHDLSLLALVAKKEGELEFWDAHNFRKISSLKFPYTCEHMAFPRFAAVNPELSDLWFAASFDDGLVRLIDLKTLSVKHTFSPFGSRSEVHTPVGFLSFICEEKGLAVVSGNKEDQVIAVTALSEEEALPCSKIKKFDQSIRGLEVCFFDHSSLILVLEDEFQVWKLSLQPFEMLIRRQYPYSMFGQHPAPMFPLYSNKNINSVPVLLRKNFLVIFNSSDTISETTAFNLKEMSKSAYPNDFRVNVTHVVSTNLLKSRCVMVGTSKGTILSYVGTADASDELTCLPNICEPINNVYSVKDFLGLSSDVDAQCEQYTSMVIQYKGQDGLLFILSQDSED